MEQLFLFQKNVMKLQLQMERCFSELAGSTGRPTIVIFDRGVLDSRAFIPEHLWARGVAALNRELTGCTADGTKRPEGSISNEYLLKRYDGVVHLVTAADGAETHYKHGVVTDDRGQTVTLPLTLPVPLPLSLTLTLPLPLPLPLTVPLPLPHP